MFAYLRTNKELILYKNLKKLNKKWKLKKN